MLLVYLGVFVVMKIDLLIFLCLNLSLKLMYCKFVLFRLLIVLIQEEIVEFGGYFNLLGTVLITNRFD